MIKNTKNCLTFVSVKYIVWCAAILKQFYKINAS